MARLDRNRPQLRVIKGEKVDNKIDKQKVFNVVVLVLLAALYIITLTGR